ncbi:MAG: glycosyltransferase family 4 protein [Bacteroidales bacterium]|jgi:glycosyltransferase involved in cell wall biosynthesis|nr:glycosyltransferase family 4 protein [Bacteroidales bacterium]
MTNNKVLILGPGPLTFSGGVQNYYKLFFAKQSIGATYFCQSDVRIKNKIHKAIYFIYAYLRFVFMVTKFDIVVLNPSMYKSCLYRDSIYIRIARLFDKKTIVFWRGFNRTWFREKASVKYIHLMQQTFFKANHTIVLSKSFYEDLRSVGCNTPYSVETTMISSDILLKEKRKFNEQSITLLFLARLKKTKGIFETLKIYDKLKQKFDSIKLVIAGDGDAYFEVEEYIKDNNLKDIIMLGNVVDEKKFNAYKNADIYLFPSYFEGMPSSVLEAMAMGLPIVCSSVGGLPDFFQQEKMGYMVNGLDVDDYVECITKIISDKTFQQISDFNIEYAKRYFLDDNVIKRIENTFLNL